MFKIFLGLHLLTAIFLIGPLAHAVTTASRGLRTGDAVATASSARMARIYAIGSLLVVVLGFGLMSLKSPYTGQPSGEFTDLWIWLSLLLWVVAVALTMAVIVPTLDKATGAIGKGEAVQELTGRVSAAGGTVGLVFVAIVFLMVYQPGS